jgi:hypothetical protein
MSRDQSLDPVEVGDAIRIGEDQNLSLRAVGAPVAGFMREEAVGMMKVSDLGKPIVDEHFRPVVG